MHDPKWWKILSNKLKPFKHNIVFYIDGIDNTNSLNIKFVHWEKLINNIHSLRASDINATWKFKVLLNNKHQIDKAKKISQELGFKNFFTYDGDDKILSTSFDKKLKNIQ